MGLMSRIARASVGERCYHVINRGNARAEVFHGDGDYRAFVELLAQACGRVPMRVLAYCVMPNHFHLALWPYRDGDLSRWMQWLLTAHVRRYHTYYGVDKDQALARLCRRSCRPISYCYGKEVDSSIVWRGVYRLCLFFAHVLYSICNIIKRFSINSCSASVSNTLDLNKV